MAYAFTLSTVIPASPADVYAAWLESAAHSEMTGGEAVMSDEIGAEVSAWGGYITGRNVELVPGERIVQSWRTSEFADEHEDSIVTLTLEEVDGGTLLTLEHSNLPEEQTSYELGGWEESYFVPMKDYFAKPKRAGKAKAKMAAPRPARARKTKRAASAKTVTAGKRRTGKTAKSAKRSVRAKARPKRAARAAAKAARAPARRRAKAKRR